MFYWLVHSSDRNATWLSRWVIGTQESEAFLVVFQAQQLGARQAKQSSQDSNRNSAVGEWESQNMVEPTMPQCQNLLLHELIPSIFPSLLGCLFTFLTVSFDKPRFLDFEKAKFINVLLLCQYFQLQSYHFMFSSNGFTVLTYQFKTDASKSILLYDMKRSQILFFLYMNIELFWSHLMKNIILSVALNFFDTFVENHLALRVWVYFWISLFCPIDLSAHLFVHATSF